jgi:ribonuclease P protein component
MRKEQRLAGDKRFSEIRQERRAWSNRLLVLKKVPNGLGTSRFGFVVSKRIGGAVVRNRVKRRLREAVRLVPVESGWDIVLIARRDTPASPYGDLCRAAEDLFRRSKVLSRPPASDRAAAEPGQEADGADAGSPGTEAGS